MEQGADPQSPLWDAGEAAKLVKASGRVASRAIMSLPERVKSAASTAQNAPADLEAAFNFQDTIQPLKIFDSVVGMLTDVWAGPLSRNRTNPVV